MNKNILSPHSLNKRKFNSNYESKKNFNPNSKNKSFKNIISDIYNSLYENFFPFILKLSKKAFFEKLDKEVNEIFLSGKLNNTENIKLVAEMKKDFVKKYEKDYKFLSKEFQNYLKNKKNYNYLTHYRKHCFQKDIYALHYCSPLKKGKFIEITNNSLKNKEVLYVICEGCKQCYLSKFIIMFCSSCNRKYYSNILPKNESEKIVPATWKKYHCSSLINEIMKCIKCKSVLYLNLATKYLVCLNKKCNFTAKQESILWTCNICSQEFRSEAKIYNPLEFQVLKKSINLALLKQVPAAPSGLPCKCKKDLSKLIFYHKETCKGELYKGKLIENPIIVCSKCHAINFEEKFTWICPICSTKFHLHKVKSNGPFSKKKYIINKEYNRSSINLFKRKNKENNDENMKKIYNYNHKDNNLYKSTSNIKETRHYKYLSSVSDLSLRNMNKNQYTKIEPKILYKNIDLEKEINVNTNNGKQLINSKIIKNKTDIFPSRRRHHSTLKEILQKRALSQSNKVVKPEKEKINKSLLTEPRIKSNNLVKRIRYNSLYESANLNITHSKLIDLNQEKEKEKKNKEKKFQNIVVRKNINLSDNKSIRRSVINSKLKQPISPIEPKSSIKIFKNESLNSNYREKYGYNSKNEKTEINKKSSTKIFKNESLKNNYVEKYKYKYKANNEKTGITNFSKPLIIKDNESMNSHQNSSRNYPLSNLNLNDNTNNSSKNKNKKRNEPIYNSDSKINEAFRFSKITNKLETEASCEDITNQLIDSSRFNINSNNSSFGLSLIANNSLINSNNNFKRSSFKNNNNNLNNNIKTNYFINNKDEKEKKEIDKENTIKLFSEKKEEEINEDDDDEDYDKIEDLQELLLKLKKKKEKLVKQREKEIEKEREKNIENEKEKEEDNFNSELYESKEESSSSSEEEDENKDTIKDDVINSNPKKNYRESLVLKSNFRRLSILISQDKIDNLSKSINIPSIEENDYNYLKPIGEGTYGIVYLVENKKTSEQFALKKIICRDFNELIKQKNELELLFSVNHEHILKLYGVQFKYLDETTSAIYVLMELAQNDWNQEIKRRIMAKKYYSENEIINILKQIIKAFLFLQDKNIVHRDVKPQNILLFPNNIFKIADFGEAKFIKNVDVRSTLKGSELYMSPLLYKGYKFNQHNVLHNPFKSDIFSLGYCLLYAMCLNIKILDSIRELTTMKSVITNIEKYIAHSKYSDKLMNIIYKMVDTDEDLRFDFEDLSNELEKL